MNFLSLFKRKLIYKFKKKISIDRDNIKQKSLDDLLYYYGSDKANSIKNSNIKGHGFSKIYEQQFSYLKNKDINILELGSFSGASAAAFSKYFTSSKIFCFDINISNFIYESKNIYVSGVDINNFYEVESCLKNIFKNHKFNYFDIIIDDGSHYLSDILKSLNYFFKFVKNKGVYIIEDYRFPNYFTRNNDVNDILIDKLIENLEKKKFFESGLINKENQKLFFEQIDKIDQFKGLTVNSDICLIKKK